MAAQYIHYGSPHFDTNEFLKITNRFMWTKPNGGMWSSPCISEFGWKEWCESEDFRVGKLLEYFVFELKPDSNILTIHGNATLIMLKIMGYCIDYSCNCGYKPCGYDQYYLDFEKILNDGYDAIQVFINNETYWSLYGWDCDSLLILNPDCVVEVKSSKESEV